MSNANGTHTSNPTGMSDSAVIEDIVRKDGRSGDANPTRTFLCPCVTNVPNRDPRRDCKCSMVYHLVGLRDSCRPFVRGERNNTRSEICDGN
jgi:hypothetical protein